jgi:tetratricopeptide (TPR) repeat protein
MAVSYTAFITYSHEDSRTAAWLQRKLEAYRVPSRLVGRETARGAVPSRLSPIFRDREELSAGSSLGDSINEALAGSRFLICICSPAARASEWVNKEIAEFRRLHGDERILCVIVDGEPYASSKAGNQELECLPPALGLKGSDTASATVSAFEHVAADIRAAGDGRRAATLKIIAGIIGVRLDELVQRDAQRRSRIWAGLAAASSVLAAAMIGLALYAFDAQKEAELRRGQAENLIGFMLGDLRQGLQPIGRLDLLDAVGDQALEYFEALDDEATSSDMLSRAMAVRQIGEVRFGQGQLETALAAFSESRETLRRLFGADESIDDYLFELGQSEFWVGYVHFERAELDEALAAMRNYLEISRELVSRQPSNQEYLAELSYALSNLGSVASRQGDRETAIVYFRESAAINEQQLELQPNDADIMTDLAGGYSWIGTAERELGNLEASETAFRLAVEQFDTLARTEDNARYLERRAATSGLLADLLLEREKLDEAYENARFTYDEFAALLARDPSNNRWRRQYATAANDLAEIAHFFGRYDEVDGLLAESRSLFDALIDIDPTNREWRDARDELIEFEKSLQK